MRLIERYLFRQLLWPTLGATAALVGVGLLTNTLSELDVLVNQHQSVSVFAKLILLSVPQFLSMVLPIALFIAALLTLNRLHTEQEIVVCFAGGMSRWRVLSPGVRLASFCALLTLVLNLWVSPWCYRATREQLFAIKTDLVSTLARDGEFTQPSKGLTVYVQSTDRTGLLHNVFLDEEKPDGSSTTFTAKRGEIVRRGVHGPAMILHTGSNQQFSPQGVLNFLVFDEYVFDLTPYVNVDEDVHFKASDRFLHELLFPDLTQYWDKHDRKRFLAEAHGRIAGALYPLAFLALAMAGVLGGSFSRTGYGRRIAIAAGAALVVRILGFGAQAACGGAPALNILQYAIPLGAIWFAYRQLFRQKVARMVGLDALGGLTPLPAAG